MIFNETYQELICAKSGHDGDEHVVNKPIALPCGHCICKACIPDQVPHSVKCSKCGEINNTDLSNYKELSIMKTFLRASLSDLFIILEKQASEGVIKLKNEMLIRNESIDLHVKYVQEEIEIRIESMKIQLDEIHAKLKIDLEIMKKELKENNKQVPNIQIENYEKNFYNLQKDLKSKLTQNEENFFQHQENLRSLNKTLKKLDEYYCNTKLQFEPSKEKISENLVGKILLNNKKMLNEEEIIEKLTKGTFETVKLDVHVNEFCQLENERLVTINADSVSIYNGKFNLIKKVAGKNSYGIALNNKNNQVFITNYQCHNIEKMDLELNVSETYGQVKYPLGICCKDDRLYVCDCGNQRIEILGLDFEYIDTMKLNYGPWSIAISNSSIGVCGTNGINFYNYDNKTLKKKYDIFGRISLIQSIFYVVSHLPKKCIYLYDEDGDLKKELNIERLNNNITNHWDSHISAFNGNLFVTFHNKKQILKFD